MRRTHRTLSALLCISLLVCIAIPKCHVNASPLVNLDNVVVSDNYALFNYENSNYILCIFLDTQEAAGSFAIIEKNNFNYLHEYLFDLDLSEINVSSVSFWNNLLSYCFSKSDQWSTSYIPDTVITHNVDTPASTTSNTLDASAAESHHDYFMNWLYDCYGPICTDSLVGHYLEVHVLFSLYETVRYGADPCREYIISATITVAGFIVSVLGLIASPSKLAALGAIASAGGLFTIDTKITEYALTISRIKHITTRGGDIIYAIASHHARFTGYVSDETNSHVVDEESYRAAYDPSQEVFDDTYALLDIAWIEYSNP